MGAPHVPHSCIRRGYSVRRAGSRSACRAAQRSLSATSGNGSRRSAWLLPQIIAYPILQSVRLGSPTAQYEIYSSYSIRRNTTSGAQTTPFPSLELERLDLGSARVVLRGLGALGLILSHWTARKRIRPGLGANRNIRSAALLQSRRFVARKA